MANTKSETKKKRKKPENQEHKTVYFNTDNPNDKVLFEYAKNVGVRNFSGWIKSLMYQEMMRRNGAPPNPYDFINVAMEQVAATTMPVRSVPVSVRPVEVIQEDNPTEIEEVVKPMKVKTVGKKITVDDDGQKVEEEVVSKTKEVKKEVIEEIQKNLSITDSNEVDQEEVEEQPQVSSRSLAAKQFGSMFGRK
ncbi:hypothetical protein ABWK22_01545 [Gottfriedia acidiceleris]|uniref:hypothetical protein n=1 Tax=Gottfriedia acidiceleris TaxID=371036 RepID=UPI003398965B